MQFVSRQWKSVYYGLFEYKAGKTKHLDIAVAGSGSGILVLTDPFLNLLTPPLCGSGPGVEGHVLRTSRESPFSME